jgi:hypothetical protein
MTLIRTMLAVACLVPGPVTTRSPAAAGDEVPETVIVTYHAKPGSEAALAKVFARHWKTALELGLVFETPHVVVRGDEEKTNAYFVEILTWRDEKTPDSAPAAIQEIWKEMGALVEARGGSPGIKIDPVSLVLP